MTLGLFTTQTETPAFMQTEIFVYKSGYHPSTLADLGRSGKMSSGN